MARIRYQDNRCIQWSQRQCQVPVQSGEVLRSLIQQWPCKKSVLYKRTHFIWQFKHAMSLYWENDVTQIMFSSFWAYKQAKRCFFSPSGVNGRRNPRFNQCHQDDTYNFPLLQHTWKHSIPVCKGSHICGRCMLLRFWPVRQCLQVSNQMITACKNYITNNGENSIWDQPQQVVGDKIKAAIHLNQVPDDAFFSCCMFV